MKAIKYPIGVQNFERLRGEEFTYVDKTMYIRALVESGSVYFLSRPRRFGKSLLLSTMEAFFEGKRELFKGLDIDKWDEWGWEKYPVIHLDLNAKDYTFKESLREKINGILSVYEEKYGVEKGDLSIDERFRILIRKAYDITGKKVVVLVDEYDKPILDTIHDDNIKDLHRDSLRAFYSVLKSSDAYLKFCFLTGVTKFGQLNIFSGLNNIEDISLTDEYAGICGITEEELHQYFHEGVTDCARKWEKSTDESYAVLKSYYDGYHFSECLLDVYNPWSVLNAIKQKFINYYWNASGGSMSMVYKLIKNGKIQLTEFENVKCFIDDLQGTNVSFTDAIPLMYQTGYLTIKDLDMMSGIVNLKFPNYEVRRGFVKGLLPEYAGVRESQSVFAAREFVDDIRSGKVNTMLNRMKAFFADFPYENVLKTEKDFQNVMYCVMALMGLFVKVEQRSSLGSADMVVATEEYIYIFEFKVDKSPDDALRQIDERGYCEPFAADDRKLVKVGVEFSLSARNLKSWKIE